MYTCQVENIIGISGKFGSGKSHIANVLSDEMGIPVYKMDACIIEGLSRFPYRRIAQRCLKTKLTKEHDHLLSNMQNLNRTMTRLEKWLVLRIGNKQIRRLGKSGEPVIIDFFGLPISKYWVAFGKKILVVAKDDDERKRQFMERNGFTPEQVAMLDTVAKDIVNYDNYKFDAIIENDYTESRGVDLDAVLFDFMRQK